MPQVAYTRLLTERQLARWYDKPPPTQAEDIERSHAIWQRLRDRFGDTPELTEAYLATDQLEGDRSHQEEERLLLIVGTLCVRSGQHALWRQIVATVHAGSDTPHGYEFEYLEDATARARAGAL